MAEDDDLFSPGLAFSRQKKLETRLGLRVNNALAAFLQDVRTYALAEFTSIQPSRVVGIWQDALEVHVSPHFEGDVLEYVMRDLADPDLPNDVYAALEDRLEFAAHAGYSSADISETIDGVLFGLAEDVEEPNPFLTAAAPRPSKAQWDKALAMPSKAPPDMPPPVPAKATDPLTTRWERSTALATRMTVTGLDGSMTQWRLERQKPAVKEKRWVSRLDDKVRETHLIADGQTVPLQSEFQVGLTTLRWPGDRTGEIGEIANCRCVMVGVRP
jgi:hypothetical protein